MIVYFLLEWLDFWAEVHLVQEEIDFSQKGFATTIFHISAYSLFHSFHIELQLILYFLFLFFFLGRYARFSWGFFLLAGTYIGEKSKTFFLIHFFFFFTPTHITTRQTGGEGWWVVNSPCLSAITTHNVTLACLPHLFP